MSSVPNPYWLELHSRYRAARAFGDPQDAGFYDEENRVYVNSSEWLEVPSGQDAPSARVVVALSARLKPGAPGAPFLEGGETSADGVEPVAAWALRVLARIEHERGLEVAGRAVSGLQRQGAMDLVEEEVRSALRRIAGAVGGGSRALLVVLGETLRAEGHPTDALSTADVRRLGVEGGADLARNLLWDALPNRDLDGVPVLDAVPISSSPLRSKEEAASDAGRILGLVARGALTYHPALRAVLDLAGAWGLDTQLARTQAEAVGRYARHARGGYVDLLAICGSGPLQDLGRAFTALAGEEYLWVRPSASTPARSQALRIMVAVRDRLTVVRDGGRVPRDAADLPSGRLDLCAAMTGDRGDGASVLNGRGKPYTANALDSYMKTLQKHDTWGSYLPSAGKKGAPTDIQEWAHLAAGPLSDELARKGY